MQSKQNPHPNKTYVLGSSTISKKIVIDFIALNVYRSGSRDITRVEEVFNGRLFLQHIVQYDIQNPYIVR